MAATDPAKLAKVWPNTHSHLPSDGRLNVLFNRVPGLTLNPMFLFEVPVAIVLGYLYRESFRWSLLAPAFALYFWKESIPMSVCLHRYFSHKGFQCSRGTQFVLYLVGCLASQGPPLWWASKHRKHHAHCDTDKDPHSPVAFHWAHAWLGWAYTIDSEGPFGSGVDEEYVQDHLRYPELAFGENFYFVPIWTVHAAFAYFGGAPYAVYVSLWSGCMCQLLTLWFNVVFHLGAESENDGNGIAKGGACQARDLPIDPLSNAFGEAYHKWHHVHPRAYHRPGIDLPYWSFIAPLLAFGWLDGPNLMSAVQ